MSRWEYMHVFLPHTRAQEERVANEKVRRIDQIEAILNEWGAQGREVVGYSDGLQFGGGTGGAAFVLKRQRS